jgi:hypothetical protein
MHSCQFSFVLCLPNMKQLMNMPSSGMLRRVALVRTDVSEECSASNIRVTIIGKLGTTLAELVRNTRLRMQRGVAVAGNGFSLLNGQTTKPDSVALVVGGGGRFAYSAGFRIQDLVVKCTWIMPHYYSEHINIPV